MLFHRIFTLGVHITAANLDGIQFVGTNTAAQNFFSAGFGVEQPLPTLLNERDGKGPIIIANRKRGKLRILWVSGTLFFLPGFRGKSAALFLSRTVSSEDKIFLDSGPRISCREAK